MKLPLIGVSVQTALLVFAATAAAMYVYANVAVFRDFVGDGQSNKMGVGR